MDAAGQHRGLFYYAARAPLIWQLFLFGIVFVSFFPVLLLSVMPVLSTTEPFASQPFPSVFFNNLLLVLHIVAALPPLLLGPWLFHAQFRAEQPKWHRIAGQVYVAGCLISAVTSLPLATVNAAGLIPRIGFSTLAVVWFTLTWLGYHYARKKNFVAHRRWIMRSYACTFAFFNVKAYLLLGLADIDPLALKVMQSCVSWQLNLFVVEIYLAASTHSGKFAGWPKFRENLTSLTPLAKDFPGLKPRAVAAVSGN